MKAMTLRLDNTQYERLRTLAYVEDRAMTDVIREAIHEYIQHRASYSEFRDSLERAMQENAGLIAELADHQAMRYLTVEEVLEINAEVMGGMHVLRDRPLLESAAARPQTSAFGADAYPDLASKAAALLHSLVLNHAFIDGNKRTAVLATLVFLDLNGHSIRWDQSEALGFVLRLAVGQVTVNDATAFLRDRMHPKHAEASGTLGT